MKHVSLVILTLFIVLIELWKSESKSYRYRLLGHRWGFGGGFGYRLSHQFEPEYGFD